MLEQQREKNQPQEGIVELSDEQLEDVAGGRINYDARIQYLDGEIAAYQYLLSSSRPPVTVVNQTTNNNNTGSNVSNQVGVQSNQYGRHK
jgi:hypothetical protein